MELPRQPCGNSALTPPGARCAQSQSQFKDETFRALRHLLACAATDPPPLTPRTKWTRRVPHPVLIGHAASLPQERGLPALAECVRAMQFACCGGQWGGECRGGLRALQARLAGCELAAPLRGALQEAGVAPLYPADGDWERLASEALEEAERRKRARNS